MCYFLSTLKELSTDNDGKLSYGLYFGHLRELLDIFDELYHRNTNHQREAALLGLSDLVHLPPIEADPAEFFLDPEELLGEDLNEVELFLNSKAAVILGFVNMALNRRKAELGIYFDASELSVRPEVVRRGELLDDLASIDWFLTGDLYERVECYFVTDPVQSPGVATPADDLTPDELMAIDNNRRPVK